MIFWVLRFLIYSSHNSWSGSSSLTAPSVSTFVFHYSISSWVSHPQTDHPWTESVYATSWDPLITISMTVFTLPSPPVSSVWGWPKCLIAHHKLNFRIWDWWCLQNWTHSHRRLVHSGHWERCCRWSGCWRWPAWCWWWRSDVWCVVVRRNRVRLGQLRTTSRSRWPPAWPLPSLPRPTNMHQHQLQSPPTTPRLDIPVWSVWG